MDWTLALRLVAGLLLLLVGGEFLVRSASRLATSFGLPALVVGLTVVAMGTSAPEFVVSSISAWRGAADIAYGNVVGSNLCNVLLILGLSALVAPLAVDRKMVRFDGPLMVAAASLAYLLASDGVVGRADGVVLVLLLAAYLAWSVRKALAESDARQRDFEAHLDPRRLLPTYGRPMLLLGVAGSLALLVAGSHLFVAGAVGVARGLGVSELVIGLTIVAVGTSLPEVATSLIAAVRGEREIAVGNVVGSNLFNVLGVLGGAAVVSPAGVDASPIALSLDTPLMIVACAACLPVFYSGWRVSRAEGALFLAYYAAYTSYLVLDARGSAAAPILGRAVLFGALPLTVLGLAAASLRWRRENARASLAD